MTRLFGALFAAFFAISAVAQDAQSAKAAPQPIKPNIVLIVLNDVGFGDLGYQGNRFNETPNIDSLAATGVSFHQAYAAAPVAAPTLASMLTGKNPVVVGVTGELERPWDRFRDNPAQGEELIPPPKGEGLGQGFRRLPELLKRSDYDTAWLGYWPLGGLGNGPEQHGFDQAQMAGTLAELRHRLLPFFWQDNPLEDSTRALTDAAKSYIEARADGRFFLAVSHYGAVAPLTGDAKRVEYFQRKSRSGNYPEFENPWYAASLASLDDSVGEIVALLDEKGLREKTLIVLVSPNGALTEREYFIGDYFAHSPATDLAPLRDGKGSIYEGGLRVPMLLNWVGVVPLGVRYNGLVSTQDLFPTLLAAGGLRQYKDFEGENLFDAIVGVRFDRDLHWHYPYYDHYAGRPGAAVRSGQYKLIQWFDDGSLELFDLKDDPGETRNLVTELPVRTRKMLAKLYEWRGWNRAPMPAKAETKTASP